MKREPEGIPVGGQFATDRKAEPDVELTVSEPIVRSSDRPNADTWQHPRGVPRFDAITAYDDEASTATIGDDLHVHYFWNMSSHWIDIARPILAQLHRAGVSGHLETYASSDSSGQPDLGEWRSAVHLPSGAKVYVGVSQHYRQEKFMHVNDPGIAAATAPEYGDFGQADVDALVEQSVRASAMQRSWGSASRAVSGPRRGWQSGHVLSVSAERSVLRIGAKNTSFLARYEGQQLVSLTEERDSETDPYAQLARIMNITGGKRGGAHDKVRQALEVAGRTDEHEDVAFIMAGRERARTPLT